MQRSHLYHRLKDSYTAFMTEDYTLFLCNFGDTTVPRLGSRVSMDQPHHCFCFLPSFSLSPDRYTQGLLEKRLKPRTLK